MIFKILIDSFISYRFKKDFCLEIYQIMYDIFM